MIGKYQQSDIFFVCSCLYVCMFTFTFVYSLFVHLHLHYFLHSWWANLSRETFCLFVLVCLYLYLHLYILYSCIYISISSIWAFAFLYSLFEHLHLHYFLHSWWANLRRESFCLFVCSCCWQTNFSRLNFICTQAGAKKCQQLTHRYAKDCWKKDSSWCFSYILHLCKR